MLNFIIVLLFLKNVGFTHLNKAQNEAQEHSTGTDIYRDLPLRNNVLDNSYLILLNQTFVNLQWM